jgi:aminoglycoside phosphotransferase family enzyme/predicted kinase
MVVDDQRRVIDYLASHADERIETHAAIVFLSGARALKLKRAVRFDYLDFSTVERRRQMCEAEVHLNRRTAPSIYRGVLAITEEAGGRLALGGSGRAVDWLVEMNRFDQRDLCDRRAAEGALDIDTMARLANAIAAFHAAAEVRADHGGRSAMRWVIDGNDQGFAEFGAGVLARAACQRLTTAARTAVDRLGALLDSRRRDGFVRQCHGDLHLRNIVLIDGAPTLFDAIEFNDELACIDVWYDTAFLLMDLARRQLPRHANVVFNRYLAATQHFEALSLLPLFQSCRAAIRAKTSATAATLQADAGRRDQLQALAREYLATAERLLHPPAPQLIAIGGLSGTGKSTIAAGVAPAVGATPGAAVLRSDEIRKELAGVSPQTRLGADGYSARMSRQVYLALADRAARVVRAGHSVIVDAVYARGTDRDAIEDVARAAGVVFVGCWLDAPESLLLERVTARTRDASDADADVVRQQLASPVGDIRWTRVNAAAPIDAVASRVRAHAHGAEVSSCSP